MKNSVITFLICFTMTAIYSQSSLYLKQPFDGSVFSNEAGEVVFSWNNDGSASYTLEIAEEPTFIDPISFIANDNLFTVNQASFFDDQNYWRVIGNNSTSMVRSFEIIDLNSFGSIIYHIDANSNIVVSSGKVSEWGNKANDLYNASQSLDSWKPDFISSRINNQPIVSFGGLTGGSRHRLSLNAFELEQANFSVFFTLKQHSINNALPYVLGYEGNGRIGGLHVRGTAGTYNNFGMYYSNPEVERRPNFPGNLNWATRSIVNNLIYFNNTEVSGYTGGGVDGIRFNTIGTRPDVTNLNFHGDIAEVIIYNSNLSSNNRESVDNYLISKYSPYPDLGPDINTCASSVPLGPIDDPAFSSITWSNGQTNVASINAEANGWYWVQTVAFGRTIRDSIYVEGIVPQPKLNVKNDTVLCAGDIFDITYTNSNVSSDINVLWSNGSIDDFVPVDSITNLSVKFSDPSGCEAFSDTIHFDLNNFPLTEGLGSDRQECLNTNLYFDYGEEGIPPFSKVWGDGSTNSNLLIADIGIDDYSISVTDAMGCVANNTVTIEVLSNEAPVIGIAYDTVCRFSETLFYDASIPATGDNITEYMWIFPDVTLYGDSVLYTADYTEPYPVEFIIQTEQGCQNRLRDTTEMLPQPLISFSFPNTICEGDQINFISSQTSPEQITVWEWSYETLEGEYESEIGAIGSYTFKTFGDYEVSLTGTDINECEVTESKIIKVGENPTPDFTFEEVCAGETVDFLNNSYIGSPASISNQQWGFGDGSSSSQINPSKPYLTAGNYDVKLKVNANNGCSADTIKELKIHAIPKLDFNVGTICAGIPVTFEDASLVQNGSVAQVFWDFGDGMETLGFSTSYSFPNPGEYGVLHRVKSSFGCENFIIKPIKVNDYLNANFSLRPQSLIAGFSTEFTNISTGETSFYWNINDSIIFNEQSVDFTLPESLLGDSILISLTANNNFGCEDVKTISLPLLRGRTDLALGQLFVQEINGFYTIGVEIENKGTTPIVKADLFLRTASTPLIKETWEGVLFEGEKEIYIFNASPPIANTSQNKQNDFVCVEGKLVSQLGFIDEDLSNNERCKNVSGEETVILLPFPNPASNEVNIKLVLPEEETVSLAVYDQLGRKVRDLSKDESLKSGLNLFKIDVSNWSSGVYTVFLNTPSEKKVVKFSVL